MRLKEIVVASTLAIVAVASYSCAGSLRSIADAVSSKYTEIVAPASSAENLEGLDGGVCMPEELPPVDPRWYTKIDYGNPTLTKKLEKGRVDVQFLERVETVCDELDMHCMGLLSVMDFETGGSFKPSKKNMAGSGAVGLIQFMPSTARDLGTSVRKLSRMSQEEQMDYVGEYFKKSQKTSYDDPRAVALTVFYPVAAGKPRYVIARAGSNTYQLNKGVDFNKDGKISAWEYASKALHRGYLTKCGI